MQENKTVWIMVNAIFNKEKDHQDEELERLGIKVEGKEEFKFTTDLQYIDLSEISGMNKCDNNKHTTIQLRNGDRWMIAHKIEDIIHVMNKYGFIDEIVKID